MHVTRSAIRLAALPLVILAPFVTQPAVQAQPAWDWPERAWNLKELPTDFPPQRLRAVMTGFTRALGVRCSHCHVGEEGQPLATYDFPSDDNPKKNVARAMLRMLGEINEHLDKIEPSGPARVNMWCHTCHDGRPRPIKLEQDLLETFDGQGLDATLGRYRELRDRHYGRSTYDFTENTLNVVGYDLLERGEHDAAIAVFRLNTEFHPHSSNAFDSLAEACMTAGRKQLAIVYYQKSLELDAANDNAVAKLKELAAVKP